MDCIAYRDKKVVGVFCAFFVRILKTTVSSGINNLLDRKYAASILPNATAFGSTQHQVLLRAVQLILWRVSVSIFSIKN
jgi:hypothetical protein